MNICLSCGSLDPRSCPCNRPLGGPGTELREIIPKFLKGKDCGCEDVAAYMDRIGPDGCRRNREKLVNHLVSQSAKLALGSVVPEKMRRAQAEKWLAQAIERAEAAS